MTDQLQAARDEIAEMCGWKRVDYIDDPPGIVRTAWCHELSEVLDHHPIPACLNFVSRVWPDEPYRTEVSDMMPDFYGISTHDARLEYWMCKLLDALVWLRDNDRPVFDAACEKIRKEIRG